MSDSDRARVRQIMQFLGLRAQATAMGLVQLCTELRRVGVIDEAALERIKSAIADEVAQNAPRTMVKQVYEKDIRGRLDPVFAGCEPIGPLPEELQNGSDIAPKD